MVRRAPSAALLVVAGAASEVGAQTLTLYHEGSSYSHFGSSVAALADVDGDGSDEYVVGAPLDSQSSAWSGRVMLYSGKTGTLLRTWIGATGTLYGQSVADAGDVNGDGFHDIVIGAPGYSSYGTDNGRFSIVNPIDGSTIVSMSGSAGDWLGQSVSGFDDVDGDGLADVIVGAPGWNGFTGKVTVYNRYGQVLWSVAGTQAGAWFGIAVADAGNIKTYDGYRDVVVGEPYYTASRTTVDIGRAHVLSGQDGASLYTLTGDDAGDAFGSAVSGGSDLNGDSYIDVLIGAPGNDLIATDAGFARAFSGFTGNSIGTIRGDDTQDRLGQVVHACRGDLNGDGIADFLVGAPSDVFDGEPGLVKLCGGGFGFTVIREFAATTDHCNPRFFGSSIATGQFSGGGPLDIAIGMAGDYWTCDERGSVWVYTTWVAFHLHYGTGWLGQLRIPTIDLKGEPVLGDRVQLLIGNSQDVPTTGLLLVGLDDIDVPTSADGHLLVAPLLILALPIDKDGLTLDGRIPSGPALAGVPVFLQVLEVDPYASKGLSFSDGLELVPGFLQP